MARTVAAFSITLGVRLSGALPVARFEDDSALVQTVAQSHQQQAASSAVGASRLQMLERLAAGASQSEWVSKLKEFKEALYAPFDCKTAPKLCQAPFNCQDYHNKEMADVMLHGASPDGQPNFHMWCTGPQYQDYMHACIVEKDLVKAGHIQYQWSVDQKNGIDELDGSYCFIEGHCTNEAVTNQTTVEEATQMCDERYGREGWSTVGSIKSMPMMMEAMHTVPLADMQGADGFHDTRGTKLFLKLACAMGNYHCDVMYCKETYCKNPYYVKKYSHLLPKAPGHLLQSRDWLP